MGRLGKSNRQKSATWALASCAPAALPAPEPPPPAPDKAPVRWFAGYSRLNTDPCAHPSATFCRTTRPTCLRPGSCSSRHDAHALRARALGPPVPLPWRGHRQRFPERTGSGALPHGDEALRAEARALLELAARGEAVPRERAERFARDYVESLAMGAAALAVLDGGRFAGARLVDLAVRVVARGHRQQRTGGSG